ncbi:MAG: hypothetical protein NXY57DRAFT_979703 [Lentinula lateritia]|nr:MAG: hypothetical protein NXY57DRAFT_979703 [Lentinula lateritia]
MQLISIKVCSALLLGFLSLTRAVSAPVRATSVGDSPSANSKSNPASPDMNTINPRSLSVYARSRRPDLHRQSTLTVHAIVEFQPSDATLRFYYRDEETPGIELAVKGSQPALEELQFKVFMKAPWLSKPGLRDGDTTALSGHVVASFGTVLRFQNGKGQLLTKSWDLRKDSFDLNRFA